LARGEGRRNENWGRGKACCPKGTRCGLKKCGGNPVYWREGKRGVGPNLSGVVRVQKAIQKR